MKKRRSGSFHRRAARRYHERREPEPGVLEIPVVSRIHFVVAEVLFLNLGGSIMAARRQPVRSAVLQAPESFGAPSLRLGTGHATGAMMKILRAAAVLAESARRFRLRCGHTLPEHVESRLKWRRKAGCGHARTGYRQHAIHAAVTGCRANPRGRRNRRAAGIASDGGATCRSTTTANFAGGISLCCGGACVRTLNPRTMMAAATRSRIGQDHLGGP